MNRIEIFNEVSTILLSYVLILFTEFNFDYEINSFEFDMIFSTVLGFNVLVHMVLLMTDSIRSIVSKVRKICCKRKLLVKKRASMKDMRNKSSTTS